ncbi:MAG: hypothetical protein PHY51_04600 [Candidatus Gracilibacteria bacterium]|nr:hypothetical protein [Candidatus Gracilibacteria bacterium]
MVGYFKIPNIRITMNVQLYGDTSKKSEFIEQKIIELYTDDVFLSLDPISQNEIIEHLNNSKSQNEKSYSNSQLSVYGFFVALIFLLIINVFIDLIYIPIKIYFVFFLLTLGTMLLIYTEQKRTRLKRVALILDNWDEIPSETRSDFILVVKNEIEASSNSPLGKIFFSNYVAYSVYIILVFLFIKVIYEDKMFSPRLFMILYLDLLVIFFFQNPTYILDNQCFTDFNNKKDLLKLYHKRIKNNYIKSIFIIITFFIITLLSALFNFKTILNYF